MCVYDDGVGAEFRNFIKSSSPIQQMGRLSNVANAGEYRAEDLAAFVSGQHLLVTGVYGPRCAKKLLAYLTTKESETILIKRILFLTP